MGQPAAIRTWVSDLWWVLQRGGDHLQDELFHDTTEQGEEVFFPFRISPEKKLYPHMEAVIRGVAKDNGWRIKRVKITPRHVWFLAVSA